MRVPLSFPSCSRPALPELQEQRLPVEKLAVARFLQEGLDVPDDGRPVEGGHAFQENTPPGPWSDCGSLPSRLRQGVLEQLEVG